MGSVQRLENQNTLINWGLVVGHGAIITEVDYEKNIVLDIRYPVGIQTQSCYLRLKIYIISLLLDPPWVVFLHCF